MKRNPVGIDFVQKIKDSCLINDEGCWVWQKGCDSSGYGCCRYLRKMESVHRVSYKLIKGPIPEGFEIDHLCRNRKCVNPDHLEAVTHRENLNRILPKTACINGHDYTEENTLINNKGYKVCKACDRASSGERHKRYRDKDRDHYNKLRRSYALKKREAL